jgi:proteasome component ECM29
VNYTYISSVESQQSDNNTALTENELTTEQRSIILPSFKQMVNYIHEMAEKKMANPTESYTYGQVKLSYNLETYTEVISHYLLDLFFFCLLPFFTDSRLSAHLFVVLGRR